jgi:NAD(P)H-dependent flavin oxidoreductase YrpB (nitropropane dioxygenase family)
VVLDELKHPIVLAPLAGGASTPELTAAVSEAGGLGFLASGYLAPESLEERLVRVRIQHATSPLRAAARQQGDPDEFNSGPVRRTSWPRAVPPPRSCGR